MNEATPVPPAAPETVAVELSAIGTVVNSLTFALRKGAYNEVPVNQLHILTATILHLESKLPTQQQPPAQA